MKLKTAIMCGVLLITALFFGAMLNGPLPVAIAAIGVIAWSGFVLGLYAVIFKPSRLRVVDPEDWNEQVQLYTIDITGHAVLGDVVSLRSACDWKAQQDAAQPHVTHTWRAIGTSK